MSVEQMAKVRVLQEAGLLERGELKLLTFLADYADAGGHRIFPSDARLVQQTRWTPRYLRLVKSGLVRRRWLVCVRPAAAHRRAIYKLVLPSPRVDDLQLRLPFRPVEKPVESLFTDCGRKSGDRISGSASEDLQIRHGVGDSPTTSTGASTSAAAPTTDPSTVIRPVLPVRKEDPAHARRDPLQGFTPIGEIISRLRASMLHVHADVELRRRR